MPDANTQTGEIAPHVKRPNVGRYTSITHAQALEVCTSKNVTGGEAKTLLGLMGLAREDGTLPYTMRRVAELLGKDYPTTVKTAKKFVRLGILVKLAGESHYRFNPYRVWNVDAKTHNRLARQVDRHYETCIMEAGTTKGNHHDRLQA